MLYWYAKTFILRLSISWHRQCWRRTTSQDFFKKFGDFPTQTDPEFPVAQSARDFYKNGPSFLNRYLPFWMTNYAQRAIAVVAAGHSDCAPTVQLCA